MNFKFRKLPDYTLLVPDSEYPSNSRADHIELFIANRFRGTLCFALIEDVNIINVTAEGRTKIYSNFAGDILHEKNKRYYEIIRRVKSEFEVGLPEHEQWYTRSAYILTVETGSKLRRNGSEYNWQTFPKDGTQQPRKQLYGAVKKPLMDWWIEDYLEYYAELMHNDFGLQAYPFYSIIVRPVAFKTHTKTAPVGNLYLHFATTDAKDDEFYMNLVNDLLLVWFNVNGISIYEHIQGDSTNKPLRHPYYPNLDDTNSPDKLAQSKSGVRVADFYDCVLGDSLSHERFEKKLSNFVKKAIDFFTRHKRDKNDFAWAHLYELRGRGLSKLDKLSPEHLTVFKNILLQREFFKIGFLIFRFSSLELHMMIAHQAQGATLEAQYETTVYGYFWSERWLPLSHTYNDKRSRIRLYKSLSALERKWFEDYLNESSTSQNTSEVRKELEEYSKIL